MSAVKDWALTVVAAFLFACAGMLVAVLIGIFIGIVASTALRVIESGLF